MTRVAAVILNWNGEEMLNEFLPSIIKYTAESELSIVVADNGSTDGSISLLKEKFPIVKIISLDNNYGYAGGYNRALQQIKEEYFFIINSDIEFKNNPIPPLLQLLDNDSTIGAVMPKILSQRDPNLFEYAGAAGGYIDKYGFPFCRGRIIKEIEKDSGQYNDKTEIFWASGAALFISREKFNAIGGFDSSFFAHMEEIDLCWRLKNMGYKIMCEPKSEVYHVGGASLNNESPYKLYLNYRNSLYLLHKNLPDNILKRRIFSRMIIDGLLSIVYLLTGKFTYFNAVVKAHKDYRINRKSLTISRGKLSSNNKITQIYNGSIILSYILGNKKFSKLNINKFKKCQN